MRHRDTPVKDYPRGGSAVEEMGTSSTCSRPTRPHARARTKTPRGNSGLPVAVAALVLIAATACAPPPPPPPPPPQPAAPRAASEPAEVVRDTILYDGPTSSAHEIGRRAPGTLLSVAEVA